MALKRVDPFGRRDLGPCASCGEGITWADIEMVQVAIEDRRPVSFHIPCFQALREGLNLFAEVILHGQDRGLLN